MKGAIQKAFSDSSRVIGDFHKKNADLMVDIINLLIKTFRNNHKVLLFGNGGSAADAQHLAAELVNRISVDRKALPAIALTTDTSILTSIANDTGFDQVFARQVEALGRLDDVVIALSTSGNSVNVLEGLNAARKLGAISVGFTGGDGGRMARECDICLTAPSYSTTRIQEAHILAGHVICNLVEKELAD
jgi:D-sedoheptulose 7-phosphate isomerase